MTALPSLRLGGCILNVVTNSPTNPTNNESAMERQNEGPDISINGTTELSSKLKVSHQNHVYFILNRQNISYALRISF